MLCDGVRRLMLKGINRYITVMWTPQWFTAATSTSNPQLYNLSLQQQQQLQNFQVTGFQQPIQPLQHHHQPGLIPPNPQYIQLQYIHNPLLTASIPYQPNSNNITPPLPTQPPPPPPPPPPPTSVVGDLEAELSQGQHLTETTSAVLDVGEAGLLYPFPYTDGQQAAKFYRQFYQLCTGKSSPDILEAVDSSPEEKDHQSINVEPTALIESASNSESESCEILRHDERHSETNKCLEFEEGSDVEIIEISNEIVDITDKSPVIVNEVIELSDKSSSSSSTSDTDSSEALTSLESGEVTSDTDAEEIEQFPKLKMSSKRSRTDSMTSTDKMDKPVIKKKRKKSSSRKGYAAVLPSDYYAGTSPIIPSLMELRPAGSTTSGGMLMQNVSSGQTSNIQSLMSLQNLSVPSLMSVQSPSVSSLISVQKSNRTLMSDQNASVSSLISVQNPNVPSLISVQNPSVPSLMSVQNPSVPSLMSVQNPSVPSLMSVPNSNIPSLLSVQNFSVPSTSRVKGRGINTSTVLSKLQAKTGEKQSHKIAKTQKKHTKKMSSSLQDKQDEIHTHKISSPTVSKVGMLKEVQQCNLTSPLSTSVREVLVSTQMMSSTPKVETGKVDTNKLSPASKAESNKKLNCEILSPTVIPGLTLLDSVEIQSDKMLSATEVETGEVNTNKIISPSQAECNEMLPDKMSSTIETSTESLKEINQCNFTIPLSPVTPTTLYEDEEISELQMSPSREAETRKIDISEMSSAPKKKQIEIHTHKISSATEGKIEGMPKEVELTFCCTTLPISPATLSLFRGEEMLKERSQKKVSQSGFSLPSTCSEVKPEGISKKIQSTSTETLPTSPITLGLLSGKEMLNEISQKNVSQSELSLPSTSSEVKLEEISKKIQPTSNYTLPISPATLSLLGGEEVLKEGSQDKVSQLGVSLPSTSLEGEPEGISPKIQPSFNYTLPISPANLSLLGGEEVSKERSQNKVSQLGVSLPSTSSEVKPEGISKRIQPSSNYTLPISPATLSLLGGEEVLKERSQNKVSQLGVSLPSTSSEFKPEGISPKIQPSFNYTLPISPATLSLLGGEEVLKERSQNKVSQLGVSLPSTSSEVKPEGISKRIQHSSNYTLPISPASLSLLGGEGMCKNSSQPNVSTSELSFSAEQTDDYNLCASENNERSLRNWSFTDLGKELSLHKLQGKSNQSETNSQKFIFNVATYNVLAQKLLTENSHLYNHCKQSNLSWEHRKWQLLNEIQQYKPEVFCMQEVEAKHYQEFFVPQLKALDYVGIFTKRTGSKPDGCAIFYKKSMFNEVYTQTVKFFRKKVSLLDRDNVGIIVKLKPKKKGLEDQRICVATTHLLYNPKRGDIKLAQLQILFAEIDRVAKKDISDPWNPVYHPVIFCGDLNLVPYSQLYEFILKGSLEYAWLPVKGMSGQENYSKRQMRDSNKISTQLLPRREGITDRCQYKSEFNKRLRESKEKRRDEMELQKKKELKSAADVNAMEEGEMVISSGDEANNVGSHVACNKLGSLVSGKEPRKNVASSSDIFDDPAIIRVVRSPNATCISSSSKECDSAKRVEEVENYEQYCSYSTGTLTHYLNFVSVYQHLKQRRGEWIKEITTNHGKSNYTVDYIFYLVDSKTVDYRDNRIVADNVKEGRLKLLGKLELPCGDDLNNLGGLPNEQLSSDHVILLAKFSL